MRKLLLLMGLVALLAACANPDQEASSSPIDGTKNEENEKVTDEVDGSDKETTTDKGGSEENNVENPSDESDDAETPDDHVDSEDSALKKQFLTEFESIETEIANWPEGETQIELEEIASETYKAWDDALNKIFKELEKQLPAEEMNKLREDQRRWIKAKYKVASEEAAQYEDSTMESLVKINAKAKVTRERCYELVENYM